MEFQVNHWKWQETDTYLFKCQKLILMQIVHDY